MPPPTCARPPLDRGVEDGQTTVHGEDSSAAGDAVLGACERILPGCCLPLNVLFRMSMVHLSLKMAPPNPAPPPPPSLPSLPSPAKKPPLPPSRR